MDSSTNLEQDTVTKVTPEIIHVSAELLRYVLEATLNDSDVVACLPHYFDPDPEHGFSAVILIHVIEDIDQAKLELIQAKVVQCVKTLGGNEIFAFGLGAEAVQAYLRKHGGYDMDYCWPLNDENWKLATKSTYFLDSVLSVVEENYNPPIDDEYAEESAQIQPMVIEDE